MKKIKKIPSIIVPILTLVFFLFACGEVVQDSDTSASLPCPPYPLDLSTIQDAINESGIGGEISSSETESYKNGHVLYVIRDFEEKYNIVEEDEASYPYSNIVVASVDSTLIDGERVLYTTFYQRDIPETFDWEIWKKHIVFSTLLYGGFEDELELYGNLRKKDIIQKSDESAVVTLDLSKVYIITKYSGRKIQRIDENGGVVNEYSAFMSMSVYPSKQLYEDQHISTSYTGG